MNTLREIVTEITKGTTANRKIDLAIAQLVEPEWVVHCYDLQSTPENYRESRFAFTSSVDAAIFLARHLQVDWRIVMRRAWIDAKSPDDLARAHVVATLSEVLSR